MMTTADINIALSKLTFLRDGWDGYDAPAPSGPATLVADAFLQSLARTIKPDRVAPSVMGGVGITCKSQRAGRKVYIEFLNKGSACVLFSDGASEPEAYTFEPTKEAFARIAGQIAAYFGWYDVPTAAHYFPA